jgi:type VI secretion system protein ImpG
MRDLQLEYYENELTYLRQASDEFARKYPKIANRLQLESDRCEDPHVNRLLQGFALLAARVHRKIDDDFPQICEALMELVNPGYLRPIPSMTIVECQSDPSQGRQTVGQLIPAGTQLISKATVKGLACKFRTAFDVAMWPFQVVEAGWSRPEQMKQPVRSGSREYATAAARVLLRCHPDASFAGLPLSSLRFHLGGGARSGASVAYWLYELLMDRCVEIQIRDPRNVQKIIPLDPSNLKPAGFSKAEALLPFERRSLDGHRLLEEYFALPEKFLFFDLEGLEPLAMGGFGTEAEIVFLFRAFERSERQQALEMNVNSSSFRLGCTPAINIFEQQVEPIQIDQVRHEYPIELASNVDHAANMELFEIQSVVPMIRNRGGRAMTLEPMLCYRYQTRKRKDLAYWVAHRLSDSADEHSPSRMRISIVDLDGVFTEPDADKLLVYALCTNHRLPAHPDMPWASPSGDFEISGQVAAKTITALSRPTPSFPVHAETSFLWRLVSMMSLNYLSIVEGGKPAMQEILRLHNRSDSTACENQIGALLHLSSEAGFALVDSADFGLIPARGTKVRMEFDEQHFAGSGLYLFASILDRFLGGYASINSFSQLSMHSSQRKEPLGTWVPRSGNQALL